MIHFAMGPHSCLSLRVTYAKFTPEKSDIVTISFANNSLLPDYLVDSLLELLPAFMHTEILRYQLPGDRKARIVSRLMLMDALKSDGCKERIGDWNRDEHHKPFIPGWKAFNISHAGDFVCLVCDVNPVGIDIEKKIPIAYQELLNFFHAEEQAHIRASSSPMDVFYDVWARKEALLKGIGRGVVNGLSEFSCLGDRIEHGQQCWRLLPVPIDSSYICYVAALSDRIYTLKRYGSGEMEKFLRS